MTKMSLKIRALVASPQSAQSVHYPEFIHYRSLIPYANSPLGFAPRARTRHRRGGSFAFEPAVLVSSIPSLSGLTRFARIVRTQIRCLGFAPRSQSFALVASPQSAQSVRYPEFIHYRSLIPYANPLTSNSTPWQHCRISNCRCVNWIFIIWRKIFSYSCLICYFFVTCERINIILNKACKNLLLVGQIIVLKILDDIHIPILYNL